MFEEKPRNILGHLDQQLEALRKSGTLSPQKLSQVEAYYRVLRSSRYSPAKIDLRDQNPEETARRRACKLGMALIATDPAFKEAKVHFVLDGLRLNEVADKVLDTYDRKPYTGSELRYAFRNWTLLKNDIFFYINGLAAPAPWEWPPGNIEVPSMRPMYRVENSTEAWERYRAKVKIPRKPLY
jgi:hypothetical protein